MRILPLIVLIACVSCALARPQEEEAKPAPARGLLKRGPPPKSKTTTTTPAPAQEEAEYDDEGEYEQEEQHEASTEAPPSSTEGKKLVGNGVRPFRSNTDLLETLKRKRAQAAEARHASPASHSEDGQADGPVKANYNKKRFNAGKTEESGKTGKSRFTRPSKASQEVEAEEEPPTPSPRTGRTFRRGN
ncbi:uncharacterized protein LOC121739076 [Aricia agestis]|uniref:uncharacterized protein LOC121739076 n=1 Tax=Aricia agestis TaxID=91739 RepID=UPI001C20496D|nr:uncharacterized protein LOC121739076 [Aricia agestis]